MTDDTRTENILRERAAIPDALLIDRRSKDVYISPAQAVEFGLVHGVKEFTVPKGEQILQV